MSHRLTVPMAMGVHGVAPDAISHVDIVSTRLKQDIIRGKDVNLAALLCGYNPEIDHCNRHLVIGENVVPLKLLPDTRLHSQTRKRIRTNITKDMQDTNGNIRVLIEKNLAGMG